MPFDFIHHYEILDSTQDEIFRFAENGAASGTIVIADSQTSGRGRNQRRWISPEGGLYFSLLLREEEISKDACMIPLITGIALHDALRKMGIETQIKWPNDIVALDKKLAGILCEKKNKVFGIGIGINLTSAPLESSISVSQLYIPGIPIPEKREIVSMFTECFREKLNEDEDTILKKINLVLYGINREACYESRNVMILGIAENGGLKIKMQDKIFVLLSGEVHPYGYLGKGKIE